MSSYLIKVGSSYLIICLLNQKSFVHCDYTPSECFLPRGAGGGACGGQKSGDATGIKCLETAIVHVRNDHLTLRQTNSYLCIPAGATGVGEFFCFSHFLSCAFLRIIFCVPFTSCLTNAVSSAPTCRIGPESPIGKTPSLKLCPVVLVLKSVAISKTIIWLFPFN